MTPIPPVPPDRHSEPPAIHLDAGGRPLVEILKSSDFGRSSGAEGQLPYRMDLLRDEGLRLGWSDRSFRVSGPRRRLTDRVEAATVPFAQAWSARTVRRRADATMAIFESEAHGLALERLLLRHRRPPLVVVSCWLAHLLRTDPTGRRTARYRRLYRAVDDVTVFSTNQRNTLVDALGLQPERVHPVRFGVDLEELERLEPADGERVVAAGRDLGRDWRTLVAAARTADWEVDLITRPSQVAGLELPHRVHLHGRVARPEYLDALARARVVVLPSEVREYPTGQTVLLEAMALGKACVVTDTPAMREYVQDGRTALLVPPGDPTALRDAIDRLVSDDALRRRIGDEARGSERTAGGAGAMWAQIGRVLRTAIDRPDRRSENASDGLSRTTTPPPTIRPTAGDGGGSGGAA